MNFSRNLALWVIIALLVFALFNLFQGTSPRNAQGAMAFSDFVTAVEQGDIREVTIQGQAITGQFRDGRQFQTYTPDDPTLVNTLRKQGVRIRALPSDEGSPTLFSVLLSWFPMLLHPKGNTPLFLRLSTIYMCRIMLAKVPAWLLHKYVSLLRYDLQKRTRELNDSTPPSWHHLCKVIMSPQTTHVKTNSKNV